MGPSGGHATLSYTQTTVSADAADGASTITLTATTGFAASQAVGIELDGGTIQWTTQSGALAGSVATLAATLTDNVSSGNYVYTYATKIQRPVRIVEAYLTDLADDTDTEIDVVSKREFETQTVKTTAGDPTLLAYDPQLTDGVAYFWPRFEDVHTLIKVVFQRPFEDFDASGDTPDFPQEWYDALCYLTAVRLAPTYGVTGTDRQMLRQEAKDALDMALENEPEEGSLMLQPDYGQQQPLHQPVQSKD